MKYLMIFLISVHLSAFGSNNTPEAAAEAFYQWVLTHDVAGLPSRAQRQDIGRRCNECRTRLRSPLS